MYIYIDYMSTENSRKKCTTPRITIYMIYCHLIILIFQGRYIPDLYDLALVAGWEELNTLHDLGHVYWVGSVLY